MTLWLFLGNAMTLWLFLGNAMALWLFLGNAMALWLFSHQNPYSLNNDINQGVLTS